MMGFTDLLTNPGHGKYILYMRASLAMKIIGVPCEARYLKYYQLNNNIMCVCFTLVVHNVFLEYFVCPLYTFFFIRLTIYYL